MNRKRTLAAWSAGKTPHPSDVDVSRGREIATSPKPGAAATRVKSAKRIGVTVLGFQRRAGKTYVVLKPVVPTKRLTLEAAAAAVDELLKG